MKDFEALLVRAVLLLFKKLYWKLNMQTANPFDFEMKMIAMESSVLDNMTNTIAKVFPSIAEKITTMFAVTKELPAIKMSFSKEQKFVVENSHQVPFTEIGDVKVHTPINFTGNLLNYGVVLETSLKKHRASATEGLNDFNIYLAQFLSSKDAKLSTVDLTSKYGNLSKGREETIGLLNPYSTNSSSTEVKLESIISRKDDLRILFGEASSIKRHLETFDLTQINSSVKKCVDLISLIIDQVEKGLITNVTPETTKNLAFGATELAKEVEFFSIIYFRVLGFTTSVDNIGLKVNNMLKNIH